VEELVRESLGRDGHKVFIEDDEVEQSSTRDTESCRRDVEPEEERGTTSQNTDSEEGDTEAAIESL
jgi:hypothetical protein